MEKSESALVAEYYESVENRLWDLLTQGNIHLGYWDQTNQDASFVEGAQRLTQEMIHLTRIGRGQRFIDIGCGVGLPAICLAMTKGCRVDGITISPYQQREAMDRAIQAGVGEQVSFEVADALCLPFEDNLFDGAWFFESIFHMGHRPALQEAHRVLKSGAELLIADVVDIGVMNEDEKAMAKNLCNAVYITADAYPALLKDTGFELIEFRDVSQEVMSSFETKFVAAVRNRKKDLLKIADETVLEAFEKIPGYLTRTAGYVLVRAIKR